MKSIKKLLFVVAAFLKKSIFSATPKKRCYVLLGKPGCGKGTQAKELAKLLGIPHVSTGAIFRDNVERCTRLGRKVKKVLEAGLLVPDSLTNSMVADRLRQTDATKGVLWDGYPRSFEQAKHLARLTSSVVVILIELPDDEVVCRIAGRRTCSTCGDVYHVKHRPPRKENVCNVCGGELKQRSDETEEVIRGRLTIYHRQTEPLVQFYETNGQLVRVDGGLPISEVTAQVRALLKMN